MLATNISPLAPGDKKIVTSTSNVT
ncbi:unnamed protein product, partial [Rotaria magnacalcarata]